MINKSIKCVALLMGVTALSLGLSACSTSDTYTVSHYVPGHYYHGYWIEAHYNRYGDWVPGHWHRGNYRSGYWSEREVNTTYFDN